MLLIGIHSIGIIHVIFKQWFADGLTFNDITCFLKPIIPFLLPNDTCQKLQIITIMNNVINPVPKDGNKLNKFRLVLTDELLSQLYGNRYLSRQKLMNVIYLCENHLDLPGLNGVYYRTLSGPANFHMLNDIEKLLKRYGWRKCRFQNGDFSYTGYSREREKATLSQSLEHIWTKTSSDIRQLARMMKPMNNEETMMIATVYASWNDLILSGEIFSDNDIIKDIIENWYMNYHRISVYNWRKTLAWLRSAQLTPAGRGRSTVPVKNN